MSSVLALVLFWTPILLVAYHWLFFPALLLLLARVTHRGRPGDPDELPSVTVGIAAHNEEAVIEEKIRNCLAFDYPPGKLDIIVVSDASTDRTDDILGSMAGPRVRVYRLPKRGGKAAALNELARHVAGELVLITDADILLEPSAARRMARWFSDPAVGVVQVNYRRIGADGSVAEGAFDRWETWVKGIEGRLGAMPTANGMGMMLRRPLLSPIPPDTIHDDLLLGLRPFRLGYDVVFERDALATCRVEQERTEFRRKVKMGRGNMQALGREFDLLSPKFGIKALTFFSHKAVRSLIPFFLPMMPVGCLLKLSSPFFVIMLGVQLLVVLTVPCLLLARGRWRRMLFPQYYLLMNVALLAGSIQYILGVRRSYWERTHRG